MARVTLPGGRRVHPVANRTQKEPEIESKAVVPSGSIMLNLACSNVYRAAFQLGRMVNLIGDSNSGKTYLALEMLAQICQRPEFDEHRIIYDDVERALSMDIKTLFGSDLDERLEYPIYQKKVRVKEKVYDMQEFDASETVEDFHFNFLQALRQGPCIYVLDSADALTAEQDNEKLEEGIKAREKGTDVTGSYFMAKPKAFSNMLRSIVAELEKTDSFLLVISQTRANIEPGTFEKRTRSGGKALKFYASHEIWLAVKQAIRQKVKGASDRSRIVGSEIAVRVTKNKLTGSSRDVNFNHRHGYGCDDIASAIDFLVAESTIITKKGAKLFWRGNEYSTTNNMIAEIEDRNMEKLLFQDAQRRWLEIEESLKASHRKPKYGD